MFFSPLPLFSCLTAVHPDYCNLSGSLMVYMFTVPSSFITKAFILIINVVYIPGVTDKVDIRSCCDLCHNMKKR